jgi:integrase
LTGKDGDDAVFSPTASMSEHHQRQAAERKTKTTPSQQKRHEESLKRERKKPYHKFWTTESYAGSIKRAIKTANRRSIPIPKEEHIKHWTPYQLRHAAITHIAATEGLDVARAVAGQRTINVTQHYNHSAQKVATDYMLKREKDKKKEKEDKSKDSPGDGEKKTA